MSLLIIASSTIQMQPNVGFFSPMVLNQLRAFFIGWVAFFAIAFFDYRKIRGWIVLLYIAQIILLIALFFTAPIQNVHRWFKIPIISFAFQPSEFAKLTILLTLSWYLEQKKQDRRSLSVTLTSILIVLAPFFLILKQPDLGTALILLPMMYGLFYLAGVHRGVLKGMTIGAVIGTCFVLSIFLNILPYEWVKPYFKPILKDYQIERLNPNTYHQKAGQTAIALGGVEGSGFGNSEFTGQEWLPFAFTDSVFPAFVEEFGLLGALFLFGLFFGLIYFCFQVTAVAKDDFGRLLSAGISLYLAIHLIVNTGMMSGLLPITGVPLVLLTYGGSSVLSTMMALGLLQSIYSRRFMF